MTVSSYEVREWSGQQTSRPVQLRKLAAAFRAGEALHVNDLHLIRDWAVENGNRLLLERVRQELRTERAES